jgi:hypothetical protein
MRYLVVSLLSAIAVTSCTRPAHRRGEEIRIDQLVLFQHEYVNYAWGYQNRGWFIDRDGFMKSYRVMQGDNCHRVETSGPDSGYISKEALDSNYYRAHKVIYRVSRNELLERYRLILGAAGGEYTDRVQTAFDAGGVGFYAYQWDSGKGMFRQVPLSLSGDFSMQNTSSEAIKLDNWLKTLNQIYADSLAEER